MINDNYVRNYIKNFKEITGFKMYKFVSLPKEIQNYLLNRFPDTNIPRECVFRILHNIENAPKCPCCGKQIKWNNGANNYNKYCSFRCKGLMTSPFKNKEIQERMKLKFKERYGGENIEGHKKLVEKIKKTKLEKYGDENYNNTKKIQKTMLDKYGVNCAAKVKEFRQKQKDTAIKKYGSVFNKEKVHETIKKKYGIDWFTLSDKLKEKSNSPEAIQKGIETKRKHHTFNASKPEENLYKILCDKYGKDDVKRQYKSNEYPWYCDFYIKSKSLYIELQGYFTHGTHPFDKNDENDIKRLNELKDKYSIFYNENGKWPQVITIWTEKDVEKRNTAKKNNLNYIEVFDIKNFTELKDKQII